MWPLSEDWDWQDEFSRFCTDFTRSLQPGPSPQRCEAEATAAFVTADMLIIGDSWINHNNNNHIRPEIQHEANDRIEAIKAADSYTTASFQEATRKLEELSDRVLHSKNESTSTYIPFDSRLDSEEEIQDKPGEFFELLARALKRSLRCCDNNHHVRLRLSKFTKQLDDDSRFFCNLYLSSRYDWTPCRWLEAKCTMGKGCLIDKEELHCGVIRCSEDENKALDLFVVENSEVASVQSGQCCRVRSFASPTVALGALLDHNHLKCNIKHGVNDFIPSDRALLCLNLTLSLLHLSHGEWRQVKWTADNIFFLKNPITQTIQDRTPYLSLRLQVDPIPEATDRLSYDSQLLEFARLLMEICTGERFRASSSDSRQELWLALLRFAKGRPPAEQQLGKAIEACINIAGRDAAQDRSSPRRMQDYIFLNIASPLDSYFQMVRSPIAEDFEPSPTNPTKGASINGQHTNQPIYDGHQYERPQDISAAYDAGIFLSRMDQFLHEHIRFLLPPQKPNFLNAEKIKIAVIDSGVDKSIPAIRGALKGKIQHCRNFVDARQTDYNDEIGHGTIVSRLLMRIAPNAEIYVAKAVDKPYSEKDKLHCIATSINWAVQVWKVDIITMSLALTDSHSEIEENLKEALDPSYEGGTRKIVFAAAGNRGGNRPLAWPACLPGVIAVHTTDGLGNSTRFNPTPNRSGERSNFATLGHEIELSWKNGKSIFVSGSSFATPIAAGIAANVLEFARYNLKLTEDRKKRLYSSGCMRRIFREMSENRGDYAYIQPWTLWERGNEKNVDIRDILQAILQDY